MSFRLQKSIKIAKGVRLNVSKSGLGVSVGPRGAKISVGPRGVYGSAGIPGTGLSTRRKLSGSNSSGNNRTQNSTNGDRSVRVEISIDEENGSETVSLYEGGTKLNDESLLRKIKKDPSYKVKLEEVRMQVYEEILEKTNILIVIHKHSEKMTDWNAIAVKVSEAKPDVYEVKSFDKKCPEKDEIYSNLESEAKKNIKGLFGVKKKRKEYIDINIDQEYSVSVSNWSKEKEEFDKKEKDEERKENKRYLEEYNAWIKEMERLLNPDVPYIEERLEDIFSEIQLPADFSISFQIKNDGNDILLDIDLPEIEDFPSKKAQKLASGKISVKDKTQKELKEDYFTSIAGIGIYITSIAFSAAPKIETITASGYTQRVNKATGNIEDEYVYSVKFNSTKFGKLNFDAIDPKFTIQDFENRMTVSKTYELNKIEPFN